MQTVLRVFAALGILVLLATQPAQAAGIVVNSLADGSVVGACTLRDAVAAANTDAAVSSCAPGAGDDTITFSVSGTITLTAGTLEISPGSSVTIDGSGHAVIISGDRIFNVLFVSSGATLRLERMTVANGHATRPVLGGGVFVSSGATFSASGSTFTGNSAKDGGAIYTSGTVNIINSTFSENSATTGGGISVATSATGTLSVANSTFSGNSAGSGGGLLNGKTATVVDSTFSENRSNIDAGGGILNYGTLNLANTILANSTAGGDCANSLSGTNGTINAGVNLIEDGSCAVPGALTGDPQLGSLADNGGPTMTHALTAASTLAVDKGDNTVYAAYATDQRGAPRKVDGDVNGSAVCDLGAYERGPWTEAEGSFTSLVVTHTADTNDGVCDADCSLREAIAVANADTGAETITFAIPTTDPGYDAATGAHTITVTSALEINGGKVTVTGPGAARLAISGNKSTPILSTRSSDVTVANLTIRDGSVPHGEGAGIVSQESTLTVSNARFIDNVASDTGGGIFTDGSSTLNVINTLFSGNAARDYGGAIVSSGRVNVANITFSGNRGEFGGGITTGGLLSVSNGPFVDGGIKATKATVVLRNTILANGPGPLCDNFASMIIGTNNLIDDASCGTDPAFRVGTVTNLDATLRNNGGPTETHALLAGSNAIDAVPTDQCTFVSSGTNPLFANGAAIPTDQRGLTRPQGASCDIGAFERVVNRPPTTVNDTYAAVLDTPLTVAAPGVLVNDADPEGGPLQAFRVGGPSHGTLQLSPSGAFTYTPDSGYLGPDAFTYQAGDGEASTNATATITVAAPTCGIDVQPVTIATPFLGLAYSQPLSATPSQLYTFTVTAGALPPGLTLSPTAQGATLKGVPTTAGTYTFTITAQQKNSSCRNTRTYTVTTPGTVVPVLTCMVKLGAHTYRGTFGYINTTGASVAIPVGANNGFSPAPQNRSQGTTFAPGTVTHAFNVTFPPDRGEDGGNAIGVWTLRGPDNQKRSVTLTETTSRCP